MRKIFDTEYDYLLCIMVNKKSSNFKLIFKP